MPTEPEPVLVLVGGVGELYQGDLDIGRVAVERLVAEGLAPRVAAEELHYGAVAVAQRLEELRPPHFVLVGATARGRPPGSVERRFADHRPLPAGQVQQAVGDAVTGYVSVELVIEVALGLGVLPARTIAIEVEPAVVSLSDTLSPPGEAGLERALELVRAEARRAPLLEQADRLRQRFLEQAGRVGPIPAASSMVELLRCLRVLGEHGRWGRTFTVAGELRQRFDDGLAGAGLDEPDWARWRSLLDELDHVLALESTFGVGA